MACRIRYLNSAGIMKREIPGIAALSRAFPAEWLLYVSLNCYPRNQRPMEIDAIVVMHDRVLVLELKDWNGKLTKEGDLWLINGGKRGRSAVIQVEEKAKKLKTVIRSDIPALQDAWVDFRVVLTATATAKHLPDEERKYVWNLNEACSIANPSDRGSLLGQTKLRFMKLWQFEKEFDGLTGNPKVFQPSEADWHGYRVTEQNVFVHPKGVWTEHRAERKDEVRLKALLRLWAFDKLPPGLNSPDRRKLVAQRETKAIGYLTAQGSPILEKHGILMEIGGHAEEILTQHFELRALLPDWTTLDRYLEKFKDDLGVADRIVLATSVIGLISELHKSGIAHRDLGHRCIWVGSPTTLSISGLAACHLPDEETVIDWLTALGAYVPHSLAQLPATFWGTATQRDVFLVGCVVGDILTAEVRSNIDTSNMSPPLPVEMEHLREWLARATNTAPDKRFNNVVEMADAFGPLAEKVGEPELDQALIDRHETEDIPYLKWTQSEMLSSDSGRTIYKSARGKNDTYVVKVWNGIRRGINSATDLALIRLLEGVSRLVSSPLPCFPKYVEVALSPVGPYVIYAHRAGQTLGEHPELTAEQALTVAGKLVSALSRLHDIGLEHGDLSPKNILCDLVTRDVCILDAFDVSPNGEAKIGTPAYRPTNWQTLSCQCIDRYAATKIVIELLRQANDVRIAGVIAILEPELTRPSIDTLSVASTAIQHASVALNPPARPRFILQCHSIPATFAPDNGHYFLTRRKIGAALTEYMLTGVDAALFLREKDGVLVNWRFSAVSFNALSFASEAGIRLDIDVSIEIGAEAGFDHLHEFLKDRVGAAAVSEAEHSESAFDVAEHWRQLMDLESRAQIEVEIVRELGYRDGISIFEFRNRGQDFDFDSEDIVDAYVLPNRRVGEIDLNLSNCTTTLAIRYATRRVSAGDVLVLKDRRDQTSIDRRAKATRRILDGQAAIPNLIDYFVPNASVAAEEFGISATESDLDGYGLNEGQKNAFRNLLRLGPVGLLQGPPGTGKTRFIAAFVHWLVTRGIARKVLIASQSHEAVNNAIESLLSLYKKFGGRPNLLRIGSKGITDKIRPYHTTELRDRFRTRFEGALKHRVTLLSSAQGISRKLASDVVDIDSTIGHIARRCAQLRKLVSETTLTDRERGDSELSLSRIEKQFASAAGARLGRSVDPLHPMDELNQVFLTLLPQHSGSSPFDLNQVRLIVDLSREWLNSVSSRQRNFDEFLAKTRTIVTATCVGIGQTSIRIDAGIFDWVIVDEAARCTPGELAVPIQLGRRVLLVGDHLQLMPMIQREIIDRLEEEEGTPRTELVRSDFERAFTSTYGQFVGKTLTEQYRMNSTICDLVSKCFYEPNRVQLETSPRRLPTAGFLDDLGVPLSLPITWVDTASAVGNRDNQPRNSTTFTNEAEVTSVINVLEKIAANKSLTDLLLHEDDETPIGVICMYSGQKDKLELAFARHAWDHRFRRLVRIDTVDSYQGKENTIVIVSLVRSNPELAQGYVRSDNRCNVAVSRAKERLVIIGSKAMWTNVKRGSPMNRIWEYLKDTGSNVVDTRDLQ